MPADQALFLKVIVSETRVASMFPALAPNRIEVKYFTTSSRVSNLVHGDKPGLFAMWLMAIPGRIEENSRTFNLLRIIQRVNNEAGCSHVKWFIAGFYSRNNTGCKLFKRCNNPVTIRSLNWRVTPLWLNSTHSTPPNIRMHS